MGKAMDGGPVDEVVDGELVVLVLELVDGVADTARPGQQQLPVTASPCVPVVVDCVEQVGAGPSHSVQVGALFGHDNFTVAFSDLEKLTGAAQRTGRCRRHPGYRSAIDPYGWRALT